MMTSNGTRSLQRAEHDDDVVRVETSAAAVISRSEVESQLDAAHRYPRKVSRFLEEALSLATITREVAESCIYAIPRGGKTIAGPSVRLAEILASSYGNLHIATRVVDAEEREVVAQGVVWDLEKNLRVTVEARRRIFDKRGKRFDDDMIGVTGAAAGSIAFRNAVFRVVPRAYVDKLYAEIRKVAVGDAKTLAARRDEVVARLQKIGVPIERIFPAVGASKIEDIGLDELEVLVGLGTAVKGKERTIDEAFPPIDDTATKSKGLEAQLAAKAATPKATESKPAVEDTKAPDDDVEALLGALKEDIANSSKVDAKAMLDAFAASWQGEVDALDDVKRFFEMIHGPKKKPAREPGDD